MNLIAHWIQLDVREQICDEVQCESWRREKLRERGRSIEKLHLFYFERLYAHLSVRFTHSRGNIPLVLYVLCHTVSSIPIL